jgi:hypothetical protein
MIKNTLKEILKIISFIALYNYISKYWKREKKNEESSNVVSTQEELSKSFRVEGDHVLIPQDDNNTLIVSKDIFRYIQGNEELRNIISQQKLSELASFIRENRLLISVVRLDIGLTKCLNGVDKMQEQLRSMESNFSKAFEVLSKQISSLKTNNQERGENWEMMIVNKEEVGRGL